MTCSDIRIKGNSNDETGKKNFYGKISKYINCDIFHYCRKCLATGNQVGIIEFVHNAKTVYNIQRQGTRLAAMQFDSTQLYKWIRDVSQKVIFVIMYISA